MRKLLRCGACVLALCSAPALRALDLGEPLFQSVGDADSIPDNNVTALAQDAAGFIWIGTPNGLIRYDGYQLKRYARDPRDPDSLGGAFVRALLVGPDGRLWIGTDANGVSVYDPSHDRFTRLQHDPQRSDTPSHDQVRALALGKDGAIWLGTREGLDRIDPGTGRVERQLQRFGSDTRAEDERIFALLAARDGDLWIGGWNGVARRRATDGSYHRIADPRLSRQLIMSLSELRDGRIGIGTAQVGSFLLDPSDESLQPVPVGLEDVPDASESLVLAMVQPREDELWLGGFGGVVVLDPATGRILRRHLPDPAVPTSLSHAQVRSFLLDRAGQVWIGSYSGGLQYHDPGNRAVRVMHRRPGEPGTLSSASISSILELPDGRIWLGTRGDGIDIVDPNRGVIATLDARRGVPGALGNGTVISLARTGDGSLYAGTLAGMYRYLGEEAGFEAIGKAQGLEGNTIRCLLADPSGDLWVGSNYGLARWSPAAQRAVGIPVRGAGLLAADVNTLAREESGRLWVGSAGGLYVLEPGASELQRVVADDPEHEELAGGSVVGLLIDQQQRLWVDTANGLSRLESWDDERASFDRVSLRLGIGGRPFGANLIDDARGRIWTQDYVYDPVPDRIHELTRADGLEIGTPWFRSYARLRNGQLLFGGSRGLAIVDPAAFRDWDYRPPLAITELRVDGQPLAPEAWQAGMVLAPGTRSFAVEFAALDFSAPERNRYAHRLVGYDQDWIEHDAARRLVSYSRLWPGDYRLEIRGSNRVGRFVDAPLVLPITVAPQLWQTPFFALATILALFGGGYGVHRWNVAKLKRHEHELEAMVAERTQELSSAKARIETALIRLQEAQEQLVTAEKMASLGQLVAGVAHEINTPLGIALTAASVQGEQLRALRQRVGDRSLRAGDLDQFFATSEQAVRLVDDHLARAARLVRSFKQVSVDRSTDERRRFVLADFFREVIDNLALAWRRRPIQVQIDCPPELTLDSYPGSLGHVISGLAQNALQHAFAENQAGTLNIRARERDNGQVEIDFADDGAGIAAEHLQRIFEPFFTTRRAEGSIGLGLHSIYNIVRSRLRGEIDVHSSPGQGTRFSIRIARELPAATAADPAHAHGA